MNTQKIKQFCDRLWDDSIIPELIEYIKIPCKSPAFDKEWQEHGYIKQAADQFVTWAKQHPAANMQIELVQIDNRTPVIFIEIPGNNDDTILLYGHMDKQPEMTGWHSDLGPWKPVIKDGKLYGRGGADDGYALFSSLTAILALQEQGLPHARCVILIEACEESGSYDLPYYIEKLNSRIGTPSLVICLDSSAGNYEQLWNITSIRGMCALDLTVEVLTEGVHSGNASGVVPNPTRILRQLISRVEDENTGKLNIKSCYVDIPKERIEQANVVEEVLGEEIYTCFPFVKKVQPAVNSPAENLLLKTWNPTLSITGMDGLPNTADAGNVLLPFVRARLSFRFPPTCDSATAVEAIKHELTRDPPYNAKITCVSERSADGWNAPVIAEWLAQAAADASHTYFGKKAVYFGEGGSIPFMGMLGKKFPKAQFFITGLLGPNSNAHGPNEFLHIDCGKKLTCCVANIIHAHFLNAGANV